MLYLKTCNNLIYIDFTKQDFSNFIYKHGKENVNKITLIINELEPTCLYWIDKITHMERYNNIRIIIGTASYSKLYLTFIRRVLKEFPVLSKRVKIQGGSYSISNEGIYYCFYKNHYELEVHRKKACFGAYTLKGVSDYNVYCDMFYEHGAAVYGPSCLYEDRKDKWEYIYKLAITITGSDSRRVTKEQSYILYDKYIENQLYKFKEIEGNIGKLPDGEIVPLSSIFVCPREVYKSVEIFTVQMSTSSCEAQYMNY